MQPKSARSRPLAAGLVAAIVLTGLAPAAPAEVAGPVKVRATEATHRVDRAHVFSLPADSTHVAIHWPGHADAEVEAAFSVDGTAFEEPIPVEIEEDGRVGGGGESYGPVMTVDGMRAVRVTSDVPLADVTVVAMDAGGDAFVQLGAAGRAAGATTIPTVIPRSGWGADESIRFDSLGDERWGRAYYPLQKLVVHHTAGRNADPNPAATIRAIYHYHAVTKGWGDIGYQFLIDESGRVYEGRYSRDYWNGTIPTADNESGDVVEAGHAMYYNPGNMAVTLLGNFTYQAPTSAARASLVRMLAWASAMHGLDPRGTSTYVNPVTGRTIRTANITGHRDYANTGCPGSVLNAMLPTIRSQVAAAINTWSSETYNPERRLNFAAGTYIGRKFTASGTLSASKSYTLSHASSAPTNQKATVPTQSGSWFYITRGVWAGYWIRESVGTTLGEPPTPPVVEPFYPTRRLNLAAGTYIGRRFSGTGVLLASKSYTLASNSVTYTSQRAAIPNRSGHWYYITSGVWAGYWILETAGVTLGDPPPPPPPPIATYDPQRKLWFAAGTYVGRRFNAYGAVAESKAYTLDNTSSAPTSQLSTIPNQPGAWYYVTKGVWAGYWIRESAGTTLADP